MQGILFIRDLAVVMAVAGVVGWIFQRLRLSVVVGYLIAGIIIGPYTPPFALVTDLERVQTLAHVGLVFLIFSIGLGLSFSRLQRLGVSIAGATVVSSILLFNICRLFGMSMGWSGTQSLFLAGMLMVSSSAIISKILEELNVNHQRAGQMALGITVLEDIVAIVMLTLLTSMVRIGKAEVATVWGTLGSLAAFIVFLIFVALLLTPRLLARLSREANPEVRTIIVAALVLLASYWAVQIGYSLALGAFILGVVIAGTRYKDEIEQQFESLRNIFGAVFFVAIGMMLNLRLLTQAWWLVALVTGLILIARPLACALGLLAVGNSSRDAIRAGLALTPIGEFSFVIAQLGVVSGAIPETFYALAVGISLTTSILAPPLTKRSEAIARWIEAREPRLLRNWIAFYHEWLAEIHGRRNASVLWRLTSKRIVQTALQLLVASGLVLFAIPIHQRVARWLGEDWMFPGAVRILFWTAFGIVLLAPLIAIWRNIDALAMILSEGATRTHPRKYALRPLIHTALKTVVAAVLVFWLLVLLPFGGSVLWALAVVALVLAVLAAVFWRRFIRWQSKLEIEIREQIQSAVAPLTTAGLPPSLIESRQQWNLNIDEVALSPQTEHAGRSIRELALRTRFGCSVVGIDRQGFLIANPVPDDRLYPGDKLLLLGNEEQLARTEEFLRASNAATSSQAFEDLTTEMITVPDTSPHADKTLAELNLIAQFGVQVCGIERGSNRIAIPSGTEQVKAGDNLLLLGTHDRIQDCRMFFEPAG